MVDVTNLIINDILIKRKDERQTGAAQWGYFRIVRREGWGEVNIENYHI